MNETTNTTAMEGGNQAAQEGAKTFTQEEVNQIVSKRLAEDRAKQAQDLAKREQEVTRRELHITATETLKSKKLPESLLGILDLTSQEAFEKSLAIAEGAIKASPAAVFTGRTGDVGGRISTGPTWTKPDPIRDAMGL